jgi:hypothetical protein
MEKQAVKDLIYGSLTELMQNPRYYYYSSVGAEYCHWTDEGKVVLTQFMSEIIKLIYTSDKNELDRRAKELVLKELKTQ